MFHAFSTIIKEEGARAVYKGWLPSVIGVVSPNASVLFSVLANLHWHVCCRSWKLVCNELGQQDVLFNVYFQCSAAFLPLLRTWFSCRMGAVHFSPASYPVNAPSQNDHSRFAPSM